VVEHCAIYNKIAHIKGQNLFVYLDRRNQLLTRLMAVRVVMDKKQLEDVRNWADAKLATGDEPPWAWYQYMKLREALDAIIAGMDCSAPLEAFTTVSSPQSEKHPGKHLRLVVDTSRTGASQPHSFGMPAQLPM
jgi:hypothetical protein